MDGAQLLVSSLEKLGVKYIFGVPGDTKGKKVVSETFIFRELKNSKIKFIRTTHEQNAGYMADLYGRMTGRAGVCYTTLGPGSTNISTALATAQLDRSPVVCISAQVPPSEWHPDTHQYIDMAKEFGHKSKLTISIQDINDIPEKLELAFRTAQSERPGVVHVELCVDVLEESINTKPNFDFDLSQYQPKIDDHSFLELLNKAKSPLLLIGASAMRVKCEKYILDFMEKYHISALSTFHGKGTIPAQHPLYLGVVSRHLPKSIEILKDADLLINIGYDYAEGIKPTTWESGIPKKVIDIDTAPKTGGQFYQPDLTLTGDIGAFFIKLTERDGIKKFSPMNHTRFGLKNFKVDSTAFPINPLHFVKVLRTILSENYVTIVDVGEHKQVMGLFYETNTPRSVIFANGQSTLGYAMPGAIGASCACPDKNVIAVVGDGGFQMTLSDFITAVANDIPIKVFILNDSSYGIIKYEQMKHFGDHYAVEYQNPDFVKFAESFGGIGMRVTSARNLIYTLKKALATTKPTIVDIPISYVNKLW